MINPLWRWFAVKDGDDQARALFNRHYSRIRYADGRRPRLFVGPGEKMVLMTSEGDALLIWRKFVDASGQRGVNCMVFRNESPHLSSELIREACALAWRRWPGARLYTYVDPRAVRSPNPGYCFKMAGWSACGRTRWNKLLILAIEPPQRDSAICPNSP
jgi:hypothetical protein